MINTTSMINKRKKSPLFFKINSSIFSKKKTRKPKKENGSSKWKKSLKEKEKWNSNSSLSNPNSPKSLSSATSKRKYKKTKRISNMSKKSTKKPINKTAPSSEMVSKSANNSTLKKAQKTQKSIPKLKLKKISKTDPKAKALMKASFSTLKHPDKWTAKRSMLKTRWNRLNKNCQRPNRSICCIRINWLKSCQKNKGETIQFMRKYVLIRWFKNKEVSDNFTAKTSQSWTPSKKSKNWHKST